MAFDLKNYELQARFSVVLAAASALATVGAIVLMFRNYDSASNWIVYSPRSAYIYVLAGCLGLALLTGAVGFFIALNSAGQKRNTQSRLSWIGFFMNAVVLTIAMSSASIFYFFRQGMG